MDAECKIAKRLKWSKGSQIKYEAIADQIDPQEDFEEKEESPLREVIPYETLSGILKRPKTLVPVMSVSCRPSLDREE